MAKGNGGIEARLSLSKEPPYDSRMVNELQTIFDTLLKENEQLVKEIELLKEQLIRDPLTKVFSRGYFNTSLEREVNRADRENSCRRNRAKGKSTLHYDISLVMIDIDHFKRVNDTYGHLAGDDVLRQLGQVLIGSVRQQSQDSVCRYGGEEFAIILSNTSLSEGYQVAERIRKAVENTSFVISANAEKEPIHIAISSGVANYTGNADSAEELLKKADAALYQSKQNGRNMVTANGIASSAG